MMRVTVADLNAEPWPCDGCGKEYRMDALRKVKGALMCLRCRVELLKQDDEEEGD
jgi:hypothetical protein